MEAVISRKKAKHLTDGDVIYSSHGDLFIYSVEQVHPQIIRVDYDNDDHVDMFGPENVVEVVIWQ